MLLSFIGSPCSGKTTMAAMLFASLKETGQNAEFVPEQARIYIAKKKLETCYARGEEEIRTNVFGGVPPWNTKIELTDEDQYLIMLQQRAADDLMQLSSGPGTTIIADSSPINALFYMSKEKQKLYAQDQIIVQAAHQTSLFFYVKPLALQNKTEDSLRIHNEKFSKELDNQILPLLTELCPDVLHKVYPLIGSTEQRLVQALTAYYEHKFPGPTSSL